MVGDPDTQQVNRRYGVVLDLLSSHPIPTFVERTAMTTIIRNYQQGEEISDSLRHRTYTFDELDGGVRIGSDDVTGDEYYQLPNGKTAILQSIDLDWISPYDDTTLRTTSLGNTLALSFFQQHMGVSNAGK